MASYAWVLMRLIPKVAAKTRLLPGRSLTTDLQQIISRIFVDMIIQSFGQAGEANLSFTVPRDELDKAVVVAEEAAQELACGDISSSPAVAANSVSRSCNRCGPIFPEPPVAAPAASDRAMASTFAWV